MGETLLYGLVVVALVWVARYNREARPKPIVLGAPLPWPYAQPMSNARDCVRDLYGDSDLDEEFEGFAGTTSVTSGRPGERATPLVPIYFKPGEPETFEEFGSQPEIVEALEESIRALRTGSTPELMLRQPVAFLGSAGRGKTLLAKILANELNFRADLYGLPPVYFFEELGYNITTPGMLTQVLKRASEHPGCVLFIDEFHGLPKKIQHMMYNLLEEHRYDDGTGMRKLPPFTLVGATTDLGLLTPPMQRRWVKYYFQRASAPELTQFLDRRAASSIPLTDEARDFIVDRVQHGGAPWEAVQLYSQMVTAAQARGYREIDAELAEEICERLGVDELGLDRFDRQVIQVLLRQPRYRAAERQLVAMAGVDRTLYNDIIKPKLIARELLTVQQGQQLTPKAVAQYTS